MNFKPASKAPEAPKINPKAIEKHNKIHPEIMKPDFCKTTILQYFQYENLVFMAPRCVSFDAKVGPKNELETRLKKQVFNPWFQKNSQKCQKHLGEQTF